MTRFLSTRLALLTTLALLGACDSPAEVDAGPTGTDAGPNVGTDAGSADMDAGSDAGPIEVDAGPVATDAGPAEDAQVNVGNCQQAPITIEATCPTFTACPATLDGAYCYTGICIEESEIIPEEAAICPGITITNVVGGVTGRVEFNATASTVSRDIVSDVAATITVPGSCTAFFTCPNIEQTIRENLGAGGTADCTMGANCVCEVAFGASIDTEDGFVAGPNNSVIIGTGNGARTFEHCESGGTTSFVDVSTTNVEPGIQTVAPAT